jgi:hypothetical protein
LRAFPQAFIAQVQTKGIEDYSLLVPHSQSPKRY